MVMVARLTFRVLSCIRPLLGAMWLIFLITGCGFADRTQLANIQRLIESGQLDLAKSAAEHAFSVNPRSAQVYYLLGQIAEQQQRLPEAFAHYNTALMWDPDHFEVRLKLGKIFLLGNNFDKARAMANYILEFRPGNTAARTLLAATMARSGDIENAQRAAIEIVKQNPDDAEAALLLGGLYAKQGKFDQVQQLFERAKQRNPTNVSLLQAIANNEMALNQPEQAAESLSTITTLEPTIRAHWLRLAGFYERRGQIDKADDVLRNASRALPSDEALLLTHGRFLIRNNLAADAERVLLAALQKMPNATTLTVELVDLYVRTNRWVLAEPLCRELLSRPLAEAQKVKVEGLLALALIELRKFPEAELLVNAMLTTNPSSTDALLLRGKLLLVRGQVSAAIEDFRAVLRIRGDVPEAFNLLIKAYVLNGQGELAKEGLSLAMRADPNNQNARWAYVQLLLSLKEFPAALTAAREVIQTVPHDSNLINGAINLFSQYQAWPQAQALTDLLGSETLLAKLARGRIYATQKQWLKAEAEFAAVLRQVPDHPEAFSSFIQVSLNQRKLAMALERLESADAIAPSSGIVENLRGETYVLLQQWKLAETNFRQAIQSNPNFSLPYKNLARLYASQNEYLAAVTVLRQALTLSFDPELSTLLADNLRQVELEKVGVVQ